MQPVSYKERNECIFVNERYLNLPSLTALANVLPRYHLGPVRAHGDMVFNMISKVLLASCFAGLAAVSARGPGVTPLNNPCLNKTQPFHSQPWCDPSLAIDARVKDMLSRMDLKKEKIRKWCA